MNVLHIYVCFKCDVRRHRQVLMPKKSLKSEFIRIERIETKLETLRALGRSMPENFGTSN